MWIFKVKPNQCTQSYWVRVENVSFREAKRRVEKSHTLEDWKWDESGDVARCFPALSTM